MSNPVLPLRFAPCIGVSSRHSVDVRNRTCLPRESVNSSFMRLCSSRQKVVRRCFICGNNAPERSLFLPITKTVVKMQGKGFSRSVVVVVICAAWATRKWQGPRSSWFQSQGECAENQACAVPRGYRRPPVRCEMAARGRFSVDS